MQLIFDSLEEMFEFVERIRPTSAPVEAKPEPTPETAPTQEIIRHEPEPEEPTNATPPEVDANGLPWDERIHASSKAVNADGTWRKKRGVDDAVVAEVEAELTAAPAPSQPDPAQLFGMPTAPSDAQLIDGAASARAEMTYAEFVSQMMTAITEGRLTQDDARATIARVGAPGLPALEHDPERLAAVVTILQGEGKL